MMVVIRTEDADDHDHDHDHDDNDVDDDNIMTVQGITKAMTSALRW